MNEEKLKEKLRMRYRDGCGFKPGDFIRCVDPSRGISLAILQPAIVLSQSTIWPHRYMVGARCDPRILCDGAPDQFTELEIDGFEWEKEDG